MPEAAQPVDRASRPSTLTTNQGCSTDRRPSVRCERCCCVARVHPAGHLFGQMTAVARPWPRARVAVPDYQICLGNVLERACLQFVCATIAQMRFVCAIVAQSRMVEDIHRLFLVLPVAVQFPRRPMLAAMQDCVSSVTAHVSPPRARVILDARETRYVHNVSTVNASCTRTMQFSHKHNSPTLTASLQSPLVLRMNHTSLYA